MTFDQAEARFRELQARVQRGEAISRAEYEDQVSQLAVQDDRGVLWEINPRTGKWMYFDGAEWVGGTPPGRDNSTVMPVPRAPTSPPPAPSPRSSTSLPPPPGATIPPTRSGPPSGARLVPSKPPAATPPPAAPLRAAAPPSPEAVPPYVRANPNQPGAPPADGQDEGQSDAKTPRRAFRAGPLGGPNREWVPLAIGAVVLLLCAVVLFFGGRFVLAALGPTTTPTRLVVAPLASNTPVPTVVRLPTQTLPTSTPQPVIAKVIEKSVNVRAEPSTKGKIISSLKQNNQISLVGRNAAGDWVQINVTGGAQPGWVFKETLQIVSGDANALPIVGAAAPAATKPAATTAPAAPRATPTLTPIGGR
ncbi:MAG: SH3 domain-containing protein [Chloroflexi bacterium]|nr:SH3 domain-containing protein [Chloroflexota bacterium]